MHGKIVVFTDRDDNVTVDDFISIGAIALHADKHGRYDTWRCDWYCQTREELIETLKKISATLTKNHKQSPKITRANTKKRY